MPLYEYQCAQCGRFELIQKFSDAALTSCPTCGREVQKLLSAPAIQFKGTGWYVTDYARKSSEGASKSDSAKSDSAKSDSAKSEGGAKSETSKSSDSSTSSGTASSGGSSATSGPSTK